MKNTISNYPYLLIFLVIACSTSKETTVKTNQGSEDDITHYHVRATSTGSEEYDALIENQFRELENLALPFVKVHYNTKDAIKCNCEIDLVFDNFTINDREYSRNKHFSKVVHEEQTQAENDNGPILSSETVRGYVYQQIKERKLNWEVVIKTNSNSNNCRFTNRSFKEKLISKSVNSTISGDERAISKKYKEEPIGQPLLSKREIAEEAIHSVFKKIVYQLKKNH